MTCKLQPRMDKGGHYDVEMKEWMQKGGIIMYKLKGWMDKGGHYGMEIKDLCCLMTPGLSKDIQCHL